MCKWFLYLVASHFLSWRSRRSRDTDWIEIEGERPTPGLAPQQEGKGSKGGKSCIITGASSGLGYEMARQFARQSYHVVLLCRTEAKAKATMKRLREDTPQASLESFALDLCQPEQVLRFLHKFKESAACRPSLEVLVGNAGVFTREISYPLASKYRLEETFASNLFGHYLMMKELSPLLSQASGTVVSLSSFSHRAVTPATFKLWLENVVCEREEEQQQHFFPLYPAHAYSCTKLALVMISRLLSSQQPSSSKAKGEGITYLCVDPGAVDTKITRHWPRLLSAVYSMVMGGRVLGLFNSPEKVALGLLTAVKQQQRQGKPKGTARPCDCYLFGENAVPQGTSDLSKDTELALQLVACMDEIKDRVTHLSE
jgi:NAD(P)-dependent dehydrogenase (short-subunit alcohol dehydrogenase family)